LSAFPVEFLLPSLPKLLNATEKLYRKVDLAAIYLRMLNRFADFAKEKKEG